MPYIRNNYVYLAFLFLFLAVNVGMFVGRIFQFLGTPVPYIIARACGKYRRVISEMFQDWVRLNWADEPNSEDPSNKRSRLKS